ncbi:methyltransferase domain-containing protein [Oceanicola sp. 502str15]|uniref:methyltransferase domain-containing protein n=1 Tax=Oceanicola sp. 502str15 TaxID=2696061 RepID=UPI0020952D14|nr:class I SAM-dependent methyltransferase [Oceanicola sp. 502str15]MCO6383238.1 hypothetical protein [Oceanicola sp. 502str15]
MSLLTRLLGRKRPFTSSGEYWAERYARGRTSGPGSYGRLADYKAEVINALVAEQRIESVVEFGCGDGNQASLFKFDNYTGVDVVEQVVRANSERFADRPSWQFITTEQDAQRADIFDMSMSLDVIYHLVEDNVFDAYMLRLTRAADRYVLIYATDEDRPRPEDHVRDRKYSDWMARNAPGFVEERMWANPHAADVDDLNPKDTTRAFFRLYRREGRA